ncbi:MAG: IS30 family transposase [candidate division KSB1 bacterium]|nr:IS30 family transposase [candidate division KSB1 bacterium]MDZ7334622.1 IS30 family transposase [candidate division KSB1 bacterium]MDZ7356570.1 IS30 family transposase [candidate division KSB1 bacterium]MDZ7399887.1 IS30 family transposase [candidate division KSB1 bacterium]
MSRELRRKTGLRGFRPKQAQHLAAARRFMAAKAIHFTDAVKKRVEFYLCQDWSPEQISGYLKLRENIHISHETIYRHIWADQRTRGTVYRHLRWSLKKKRKCCGNRDRRGQIPNRISNEQRPPVLDQKLRLGDWELGTIIGVNHHGALVFAVERKSQFICLKLVTHKTAELVTAAIIDKLASFKH